MEFGKNILFLKRTRLSDARQAYEKLLFPEGIPTGKNSRSNCDKQEFPV